MMGRPQARYLICSGPSNGTRLSSSGNRAMFVAIRRASSAVNGLCGCGFVLDPLSRRRACSQMKDRTQEYRRLAAECLRLAGTTDDANSHAQYTALAQMWTALAEEASGVPSSIKHKTPSTRRSLCSNNRLSPRRRKPISHKPISHKPLLKTSRRNSTSRVVKARLRTFWLFRPRCRAGGLRLMRGSLRPASLEWSAPRCVGLQPVRSPRAANNIRQAPSDQSTNLRSISRPRRRSGSPSRPHC
jgi:hypothetical protein